MKLKTLFAGLAVLSSVAAARADLSLTDFYTQNQLNFAFTSSSWSLPVNQFQLFTDGSVFGQEVTSLSGGNPTVSGGAGRLGLNLDLSGNDSLQLTARLLPGNQATLLQVLLFDADGTILRYSYSTNNFNTATFSSANRLLSSGITVVAGVTPGLDLSHITTYEVQGNFFDPSGLGTAAFRAQFDDLRAISTVPEPSTLALAGVGLVCFLVGSWFKRFWAGAKNDKTKIN